MDALLGVQELTVRFGGVTAVDNVTATVEEGQFVGLIGPNGAGKTTFIDAVTGLVGAQGSVKFGGDEIAKIPAYQRIRAGLGRTFQSLELFEDLTVRENLLAAAEPAPWWAPVTDLFRPRADAAASADVDEALAAVGLEDFADACPPDLSLGQRKLVTVARALAAGRRCCCSTSRPRASTPARARSSARSSSSSRSAGSRSSWSTTTWIWSSAYVTTSTSSSSAS